LCDERKAKAMQEVLENAQKQAKEDKSKHMQKKRHNQDEIKEQISTEVAVVVSNCSEPKVEPKVESKVCLEPKTQPNAPKPVEVKEIPKLPDVDVTLQTSPSPLNRQKLLTPSKFRSQTTSVAIQTEILK